jgi:HPt (histidine-containing phosphotransfer) domain-containing protein
MNDDGFERLGELFAARLQADRRQLVSLSAALAHSDDDPVPIFEALRQGAHRMRGTAAIFEIRDVAAAAKRLEQAADAALGGRHANTDVAVWNALVALVELLANRDCGAAARSGEICTT